MPETDRFQVEDLPTVPLEVTESFRLSTYHAKRPLPNLTRHPPESSFTTMAQDQ